MADTIKNISLSVPNKTTTGEAVFAWVILFLVLTSRFVMKLVSG